MRREAGKGGQRLSGEQKEPWTRNGETPLLILALLFHGVTSGRSPCLPRLDFLIYEMGGGLSGVLSPSDPASLSCSKCLVTSLFLSRNRDHQ